MYLLAHWNYISIFPVECHFTFFYWTLSLLLSQYIQFDTPSGPGALLAFFFSKRFFILYLSPFFVLHIISCSGFSRGMSLQYFFLPVCIEIESSNLMNNYCHFSMVEIFPGRWSYLNTKPKAKRGSWKCLAILKFHGTFSSPYWRNDKIS